MREDLFIPLPGIIMSAVSDKPKNFAPKIWLQIYIEQLAKK